MAHPHAIQIYNVVDKKFVFNTEELNPILDYLGDLPLAVYSICGPLRKGKSFMLSMWLRYLITKGGGDWFNHKLQHMFNYRSGAKRETTGIYLWSEPFILKKQDGTDVALLLLDSQGSFDDQTTTQENAIVFALCTLLSSYVIFNLQGQIQEDLLQFIQYFGSYARLADETNKDEPFQKLLFLIRDFPHVCDYEYGYYDDSTDDLDGRNYKKDCINPNESQPMEIKFVHEMILDTFSEVGVYLMPHPGPRLASRGDFNINTIDPEFFEHLTKFVSFILHPSRLVLKKIGGQVVTGVHLKALVNKWAVAFKSGSLPESKTLFEATAEIQHEMAKQAAIHNYSRRMKEAISTAHANLTGIPDPDLLATHQQILDQSITLYDSFSKIGTNEHNAKYLQNLNEEIQKLFDHHKELNLTYLQAEMVKKESDAKIAAMNQAVSSLNVQLEVTAATNHTEQTRLRNEIDAKEQSRVQMEENLTSQMQNLQSQISAQQQELAAERAKPPTVIHHHHGGGGSDCSIV